MQKPFRSLDLMVVAATVALAMTTASTAQAFQWTTPAGTFTGQVYSGAVPSGANKAGESVQYQAPCGVPPYCPTTAYSEQDLWISSSGAEVFSSGTTGSPLPFHEAQLDYQTPNALSYSAK
jgi:hypothetical protein